MRFVRYLLVQVVAYGLDMGGFLLLFAYLGGDPLVANVVGKLMAGLFAFVAHRSFTFGVAGTGATGQQAVRYFTLLALNIPLSSLVLSVMLWVVPMAVVAKFVADVICVILTYWLSKRFVFLSGEAASSTVADGRGEQ